jgi:ArsR family transcriptional regulator, arsenate/arsenite/antimonite-responsive transcriptional repressor
MAAAENQAFEALADPTRRTILRLLATQGESAAGDIVAQVDAVSRTGVSSHLRVLRTSGLIRERKQGRYRLYSLEPRAVDEVVAFLAELYSTSLAGLKAAVEKSANPATRQRSR